MRRMILGLVCLSACSPANRARGSGDDAPTIDDGSVVDDGVCGAQEQMIGVVNLGDPPDLLVVLDRSGSMAEPPITIPPVFTSKWEIMHTSLDTVAMKKDANIRFGLLEFPSDDNCAATATPRVPIDLHNAPAIASYFAGRQPNGNTPAFVALASALDYFNSIPVNSAGRYVLFATDGLPNCLGGDPSADSSAATVQAVTDLFNAGIKSFVIGFGTFGLNTGVLNDAAVAGGEAKAGTTKFYEANSPQDLDAALNAIAGGIIVPTCSYMLMSAPPDPNNVTVTQNGMAVPRSTAHTNGWDYYPDAMTITFFGTYCSAITAGTVTDVNFVYGCPGPIID